MGGRDFWNIDKVSYELKNTKIENLKGMQA